MRCLIALVHEDLAKGEEGRCRERLGKEVGNVFLGRNEWDVDLEVLDHIVVAADSVDIFDRSKLDGQEVVRATTATTWERVTT